VWQYPKTGDAVGLGLALITLGLGEAEGDWLRTKHSASVAYPPAGYSLAMQLPLEMRSHVSGHQLVWQYPVAATGDGEADGVELNTRQSASVAYPPAGYSLPTQFPLEMRSHSSGQKLLWHHPRDKEGEGLGEALTTLGLGEAELESATPKHSSSEVKPPAGYSLEIQFPPEISSHVSGSQLVWHHPRDMEGEGLADALTTLGLGEGEAESATPKHSSSDVKPPAGYSLPTQFPLEMRSHASGFQLVWHHPRDREGEGLVEALCTLGLGVSEAAT